MNIDLRHGDCRTVMATMEPKSVDAIVTDPPYGLAFMGKDWDHGVPGVEFWREALRVAKPGAHLLAFGGTRTFHRLACAIEDAGWEIRDCVMWVYGSGFPKSHDVSKAIDKAAGHWRGKAKGIASDNGAMSGPNYFRTPKGDPVTAAAAAAAGWGTALKPAYEPIIVARKPLCGTVAENVLQYGTGAINVDRCRVGTYGGTQRDGKGNRPNDFGWENMRGHGKATIDAGRWPANVVHDDSSDATAGMGVAARYFYCAKANPSDRNDGCDNPHPTVKPTALMTWLCRLVTPPNGVVLDPFCGSGSTGRGAIHAGAARFIGIDLSEDYLEIARRRIEAARHPIDSLLS